jgi:hypothetical protein
VPSIGGLIPFSVDHYGRVQRARDDCKGKELPIGRRLFNGPIRRIGHGCYRGSGHRQGGRKRRGVSLFYPPAAGGRDNRGSGYGEMPSTMRKAPYLSSAIDQRSSTMLEQPNATGATKCDPNFCAMAALRRGALYGGRQTPHDCIGHLIVLIIYTRINCSSPLFNHYFITLKPLPSGAEWPSR